MATSSDDPAAAGVDNQSDATVRSGAPPVARAGLGLALAVLSGILVVLSAPSQGLGWLVLVAGVPLLVSQFYVMPARLAGVATFVTYGIGTWGTLAVLIGETARLSSLFIWGSVLALALGAGLAGLIEARCGTGPVTAGGYLGPRWFGACCA